MSFNQKIIGLLTVFAVGITATITFVVFEPPYDWKFLTGFSVLSFSEVIFGAFWIQQIGKGDSLLPFSIGVWGLNTTYIVFALVATLLTGLDDKFFILMHVVGFSLFVMGHLFFRIAEHHLEEQSKEDEPERKIEKATITWR